jgi:hypothetical protein
LIGLRTRGQWFGKKKKKKVGKAKSSFGNLPFLNGKGMSKEKGKKDFQGHTIIFKSISHLMSTTTNFCTKWGLRSASCIATLPPIECPGGVMGEGTRPCTSTFRTN